MRPPAAPQPVQRRLVLLLAAAVASGPFTKADSAEDPYDDHDNLMQQPSGNAAARLRGGSENADGGAPLGVQRLGQASAASAGVAAQAIEGAVPGATQELAKHEHLKTPEDFPMLDAVGRSLLAGLSTSLGAGVVLLLRGSPSPSQMSFALALAAGVMITVSFVEMWLPQLVVPENRFACIVGAALGAAAFLFLKRLVPEPEMGHAKANEDLEVSELPLHQQELAQHQSKAWRLSVLLTLALTAHNFPEGLAVAVSSLESDRLGFVVMAAIAVHNIPEGIAIAMPVLDATGSRLRALQMATLSGLAEPLGAIVAITCIPKSMLQGHGMDTLLCVVGGIMTCVAFSELMPEAIAQRRPWSAVAGFAVGTAIMMMTHELA